MEIQKRGKILLVLALVIIFVVLEYSTIIDLIIKLIKLNMIDIILILILLFVYKISKNKNIKG